MGLFSLLTWVFFTLFGVTFTLKVGYFNSSISGVIFTPEKEFFKLLFEVKITPQKITPLLRVKLTPLEELKL